MTRRRKIWMIVASLFTAINIAGAVLAQRASEQPHAGIHLALTIAGFFWMWWLQRTARATTTEPLSLEEQRLRELQQSVDAIAVEVERIGEAQRFTAKKAAEQAKQDPQKPGA